jgi:hypothetical protein
MKEPAMVEGVVPVKVAAGSELARLLDAAGDRPLLERDGILFRVDRVEDDGPFASYDAVAVVNSIRRSAGVLSPTEAERFKADLYRARDVGTRPE